MAGLLDIATLLGYIDRAKRNVATSAERIGSMGLLNALNSEGAYGMGQVEANPEAARQYFVEQAPGLLTVGGNDLPIKDQIQNLRQAVADAEARQNAFFANKQFDWQFDMSRAGQYAQEREMLLRDVRRAWDALRKAERKAK